MKISKFKMISLLAVMLFAGFVWSNNAIAQENTGKEEKEREKMEAPPDESMAYPEYKQEIQTRYQRVMDHVQNIRKEAAELKIDNPNFRKALIRFETNANEFMDKLKNASSIPAERQEKFKKEMKSELKKLNKQYERINSRWDKLKAEATSPA